MKTKILDYWADKAGSTQKIQIQWSFQLNYLQIALFDKSNGTGLLIQERGIWNYRSAFLSYLLLDPITLFFPCVFLFLYLWLKIDQKVHNTHTYLCKDITICSNNRGSFLPAKISWVIGTKILLWDLIPLLGTWGLCKILRAKTHIRVCS